MKKSKRFPIYFCDEDWLCIYDAISKEFDFWKSLLNEPMFSSDALTYFKVNNLERIMNRISAKRSEFFFREEERKNK